MKAKAKEARELLVVLFNEIMRTRVLTIGAAVAFFFLVSLVPLLMVASALLSALPIHNLFQQLLDMMSVLIPPDAMSFVEKLLGSILSVKAVRVLSFGVLSYLWAASGAFSSLIEALNIAYDVTVTRPWWRDRLQALILTFTSGGLALVSLLCLLAGPHFVQFISYALPLPAIVTFLWPPVRIALMFITFVGNIMLLYYFGPNRKQSLRGVMPGATFAVAVWFLGSMSLSYYIQHFSNYNATYGSLGAIIGLMLWLYITSLSFLIGAELNAEMEKRRTQRRESGAVEPAQVPGQPDAARERDPGNVASSRHTAA